MRTIHRGCFLLVLGLALATPFVAAGQEMECPHPMEPTVSSLRDCVQHAVEHGIIEEEGVATSLLAKLDAAQAAVDRGETEAALGLLTAFINEVEAQAGVHIEAEHAQHMISHAEMVIDALS